MPDVLFVDGGKGQVAQAVAVLEDLQVDGIEVIGVAKGATLTHHTPSLLSGEVRYLYQRDPLKVRHVSRMLPHHEEQLGLDHRMCFESGSRSSPLDRSHCSMREQPSARQFGLNCRLHFRLRSSH